MAKIKVKFNGQDAPEGASDNNENIFGTLGDCPEARARRDALVANS